jgi:hypothetical protein
VTILISPCLIFFCSAFHLLRWDVRVGRVLFAAPFFSLVFDDLEHANTQKKEAKEKAPSKGGAGVCAAESNK